MDKDPNTQGRRAASRATKLRRRKARMNFILLAGFIALVVLLVLVTPKEPLRRATYSNATESGLTENDGNEVIGAYDGLVISEVMSSNSTAVTDENGKYADWIEIWNSTDRIINLEGVGLSDKGDRVRFLFPDVSLEPDGRVVVFCDNTNQSNPNSAFHAKFKLSSVGETVYLYDPNAYLIDSCKYPIMSSDESWALADGSFQNVTWFSPGYENSEEGHRRYRESISMSDGSVVINEIMADPISGLRDDDDELCDWVELYNTTDRDISLAGLGLSDNEGKPLKWRFPDNAVIPAKGYYLVFCTGKNRMDRIKNAPHTNFRISAEKETIILADSQGHVLDRVMIDNLPLDCSWGRNDQGQMQVFQVPTPSLPNNQSGFNQMDINLRAMNKTGVFISEVMASNGSVSTYADTENADWIELYNSGNEAVDLTDWGLSDKLDRGRRWQFPRGTTIGPGEYKVIMCDRLTDKNSAQEPHASFKVGKLKKETITLTDPTGRVLDKMILPVQRTDVSYGRTLGMSGFFYYETPTPFQQNGQGFNGYAETPQFTEKPGLYYSTVYTQFTIPEGTQVYYTTDGSDPTSSSTAYNGERLELNFTTVLRARAYAADPNLKPSDILTGTYLINTYHTLTVVSVVMDPDSLWNFDTGMLADGPIQKTEPGKLPFANSTYRKMKDAGTAYACHVEIFETDGNTLISQGAEVRTMGDFSLDMPQKSMKFRAKSLYGKKTFEGALFTDRPYTEYKSFVLRNTGNESMWTRITDAFESRLLDSYGAKVIHQAYRPCAVYLNGVYWGHMNLRERVDRFFVAQHEGLPLSEAGQMDILQGSSRLKYGTNKEFKAMVNRIKGKGFDARKNPEDLQYILDNVDVDNLFEYMALEMFVGNSDIGNTRYYRLKRPGSKWRWIWYDADYGLYNSKFDSPASFTRQGGMGQKRIDNTVFTTLLKVPEYRDKYLRKYGEIFQTFTTDHMLSLLNRLVEEITPEMELHWARWGEENDQMVITEVPKSVDGAYRYWEKRVERLRNVIRKRPTYLWELTQNAFELTDAEMVVYFGEKPEMPADAV